MLRLVRRDPLHAQFDGGFFQRHSLFWPLRDRAMKLMGASEWPDVESYNELWVGEPTHRFVEQPVTPIRRGARPRRHVDEMYDAQIARGRIPTRRASWHDYLNALVWTSFPSAKAALHRCQNEVIRNWLRDRGATDAEGWFQRLPGSRTREHDALALIDEGGVVRLHHPGGSRDVIFGHALYEGLVFGTRSMIARLIPAHCPKPCDDADALRHAEAAVLAVLSREVVPEDLPRHPLALSLGATRT